MSLVDWQAVGDDMYQALGEFVDRKGISREWLRGEIEARPGILPDVEIIRKLEAWHPGAAREIVDASHVIGVARRRLERRRLHPVWRRILEACIPT